jgi:predicted acetyltransferase
MARAPYNSTIRARNHMSQVSVIPLKLDTISALQRLLQLYYFEASFWSKEQILPSGLFDGCSEQDLLTYIESSDSRAHLIYVGDDLAGFILLEKIEIENRSVWEIADFSILPNHRGGWVAVNVIRKIIEENEHPWVAATFKGDKSAQRFFTAVSKRVKFSSVRKIIEDDASEFYIYIVNEGKI